MRESRGSRINDGPRRIHAMRAGQGIPPSAIKLLGAVAALLFLLGTGFAFAASDDGKEESSTAALNAPPQASEIAGQRTATSLTLALPDGSRETRIFETPINYRGDDGTWERIDSDLQDLSGPGLTNKANQLDLKLPERMGEGGVRLSADHKWVSYRLLGSSAPLADVVGETATYESANAAASFELTSLPTGVKEEIVLADASAPSSFAFELDASVGLRPSIAADGSLRFVADDGKTFALLPAPVVSDSRQGSPPNPSAATFSIEELGEGRWRLTVAADKAWLEDPGRVWPVTIDPTITIPSPSLDCIYSGTTTSEGSAACGSSGWPYLGAKYRPGTVEEWNRSAFKFNLSSIPSEASIMSATVGLYAPMAVQKTSGLELRRAKKGWTSTLNWKRNSASSLWTNLGGDYGPEGAQVLTSQRGSQAGWWYFSEGLAPIIREWVALPSQNMGFLLKLIDDKLPECSGGKCSERLAVLNSSAAASNRPYLSVNYIPPAPSGSKVTEPHQGTRTARRLKLAAAWNHQGVTGVTYQYRYPTKDWSEIPVSTVKDQADQAVSWPLPSEGEHKVEPVFWNIPATSEALSKSKELQVRAILIGAPEADGYTPPVSVVLDRDLGGARDASVDVGPGTVNLLTGNLSFSRTDVSIPAFGTALEFSRTHNSRKTGMGGLTSGVLGQGWEPSVPVEAAGGAAWRSIKDITITETFEEEGVTETFTIAYALLTDAEGGEVAFEKVGGAYVTPPEAAGWSLSLSEGKFVLADSDGNRTTFENNAGGNEYLPASVSQLGGPGNKTRMVYQVVGFSRRLSMVIAPSAAGVTCTEANATTTSGCRTLVFGYQPASTWGAPAGSGERLASITYYASMGGVGTASWEVAKYSYDSAGRLVAAWDPRISPALKETYAYESGGQLKTITPPGLEPWTLEYGAFEGDGAAGRLVAAKRASLVASPTVAQTTISYGVPVSDPGPYKMGPSDVGQWGQQDVPTDATAIFPPDQVPSKPPSTYSRAAVYYMDAEGQLVNTATPSGAGTAAPSISTSEYDEFGNVVRELTPQNRLRALAAGSEKSVAESETIDTKRKFSADGTELQEEWGPEHQVRLESGTTTQARLHRTIQYDKDAPTPPAGTPMPHLPTRETAGALVGGSLLDQRVTEFRYDWILRKPTKTIIDPSPGMNIETTTVYDPVSGLPTEQRQPSDPDGGDTGTTKTIYYSAGHESPDSACRDKPAWANLPCKVLPAAQPGTPGQPQLVVQKLVAYTPFGAPSEVIESPGGGAEPTRKTTTTFDAAGRPTSAKRVGGGTAVPKVELLYDSTTGAPTTQRFACPSECADDQAVTATYDTLGRTTKYQDADGNTAETTYDLLGRPVTTSDGKGTQTRAYDPTSGLQVKLEDSAAGTFTASYDADGNLVAEGLPNELVAETIYDEVGASIGLTYNKTSCAENCTWLDFDAERSIEGQILRQQSLQSTQEYRYDKVGRLTLAKDTLQGGACTTREYGFEGIEGKNSNRTKMVTRVSGVGSACNTEGGGTTQNYKYDGADRLIEGGIVYDDFGRVTSLPAGYAGGKTLTTSYFSTDMVASQTQNGVTNTFQIDAALRQRQRVQGGGLEGAEVFHYAGASDTPSWTQLGSKWTRNISGIGGGIGAIQDSSSGTLLQLTNLHGDIVAMTSLSPSVTKPVATFEYDEFGVPKQEGAPQFGWLGGKGRRTEFSSGVIQMGKRNYVPSLGRFISVDPVQRGSANAYEYASGDPVNNLDLTGEKCVGSAAWIKRCKLNKEIAAVRRANKKGVLTIKLNRRAWNALTDNPLFLENLQAKVGEWKLRDLRELRRRAAEAGPLPAAEPIRCADVATGLGVAGTVGGAALFFAPAVGPVVGFGWGVITGVGSAGFDSASRSGWC